MGVGDGVFGGPYLESPLKSCLASVFTCSSVLFQHAPFDGVVEIDAIILALKYLYEKGGEWQVGVI